MDKGYTKFYLQESLIISLVLDLNDYNKINKVKDYILDSSLLSDIASWASIISLIITLFVANRVYKININVDKSEHKKAKNFSFSLFKRDNKQENNIK